MRDNLPIGLGFVALLLGALAVILVLPLRDDIRTLQAATAGMETAAARLGSAPLGPARAVDVENVVRDPSEVPSPIRRTDPATVDITLTFEEVTAELDDGTTFGFWTFNGTVPGPMLRVMEGDTVNLTVVNPAENEMSHSIDLHAVNGPGGGANVTLVPPGESRTFSFKALNPGVYVYHCAAPPVWTHVAHGMYGAILVEPPGGLPSVDREFYVVQGEWYTTGLPGDQGHQEFSAAKAAAELPEYFTFNGHASALTEVFPLQANVGERIRLFFGVGGPNIGSNFHVIGEIFDRVYTGDPNTFIASEETWYVPPGSVSVFEFGLDVPGNYLLVDHALYRLAEGALGILTASGDHDPTIYSPLPE